MKRLIATVAIIIGAALLICHKRKAKHGRSAYSSAPANS
jgi:hypothetical protein